MQGYTQLNTVDIKSWTEVYIDVASIWKYFRRTSFKIKSTTGVSWADVGRRKKWIARIFKYTGLPGNFGPQIQLPDGHFGQFQAIGPMELWRPVTWLGKVHWKINTDIGKSNYRYQKIELPISLNELFSYIGKSNYRNRKVIYRDRKSDFPYQYRKLEFVLNSLYIGKSNFWYRKIDWFTNLGKSKRITDIGKSIFRYQKICWFTDFGKSF